jgi:hypothetical protein
VSGHGSPVDRVTIVGLDLRLCAKLVSLGIGGQWGAVLCPSRWAAEVRQSRVPSAWIALHAGDGFGDFVGFWNAWGYWIAVWAGNAAIAVSLVGIGGIGERTRPAAVELPSGRHPGTNPMPRSWRPPGTRRKNMEAVCG